MMLFGNLQRNGSDKYLLPLVAKIVYSPPVSEKTVNNPFEI